MKKIIGTYRPALFFLLIFVGFYLTLNTLYGFYIDSFYPVADPVTQRIAGQVVSLLSLFYDGLTLYSLEEMPYVAIGKEDGPVINLFEGCNGINVFIVYASFLVAFRGRLLRYMAFLIFGILILYIANLLRVALLFEVALRYPEKLYFFHKYLFTGLIYLAVFVIWYFWINRVKRDILTDGKK